MQHHFLRYNNSEIAWGRQGEGPRILLCFHGYGEEASAFDFLAKYAGNQFTIYAIDLPFHGKTKWNEGLNFDITDLLEIVNRIIPAQQPVNLLGFSLGGRVSLSLYQAAPEKIEKLVLLAPDGLKVNFWYWLATQTKAGNHFFAFTMKQPHWFFGMLKVMNKLGLINASIFKFVNYYIGNKEVRNQLYYRWTALRKLEPRIKEIKKLIKQMNTPVRLVYGRHDRIILSSVGEKFRRGIEQQCSLTVIPSGHQVLHEKHVEEIVNSLVV